MIDDVKLSMGIAISVNMYDYDLNGLIEACKADLHICGIAQNKILESDPLINRAIIFYCKAYFRNSDSQERYRKAYEALKTALSMSGDYRDV